MSLEQGTLIFLVSLFVAAEVYRLVRGTRGIIVAVDDPGMLLVALPMTNVTVRLDDGREVPARVDVCTSCLGRLKTGDQVRVAHTKDGWVVALPWLNSARPAACSHSAPHQANSSCSDLR